MTPKQNAENTFPSKPRNNSRVVESFKRGKWLRRSPGGAGGGAGRGRGCASQRLAEEGPPGPCNAETVEKLPQPLGQPSSPCLPPRRPPRLKEARRTLLEPAPWSLTSGSRTVEDKFSCFKPPGPWAGESSHRWGRYLRTPLTEDRPGSWLQGT